MDELFLVVSRMSLVGTTGSYRIKGVYFHFLTALDVALNVKNEPFKRGDDEHRAFIYKVGLNKVYRDLEKEHCVYALRYYSDGVVKEEWFDENLRRSSFVSAEELRQGVIDQL